MSSVDKGIWPTDCPKFTFFELGFKNKIFGHTTTKNEKTKEVTFLEWFGLGKKRSKLGKWLDRRGISQQELEKMSGVSRGTISRLCSDDKNSPTLKTAKKIINALKKLDKSVGYDDFWSM
jgi:putative transcriptional regulator